MRFETRWSTLGHALAFIVIGGLTASCASPTSPTATSAPTPPPQPATVPVAPAAVSTMAAVSLFDQQFIDMMVPHHEGAVAMARIAETRAQHAELKALAADVIRSQASEIDLLQLELQSLQNSGC